MEFRKLKAEEIEVRQARITEKGVILLIYKDARVDQQILDETVGAMNWQRHHTRDNKNCIVSIFDEKKGQWVEKEDCGTESTTEKEKGLASDSFKRACFNWGIGRELYTAPFIFFGTQEIKLNKNGKCYDKFECTSIEYEGDSISTIVITDTETKTIKTFRNLSDLAKKRKIISDLCDNDESKKNKYIEYAKAHNVHDPKKDLTIEMANELIVLLSGKK